MEDELVVSDEFSVVTVQAGWKHITAELSRSDVDVILVREKTNGPFVGMITDQRLHSFDAAEGRSSKLIARDMMQTKILHLDVDTQLDQMISDIREKSPDGVLICNQEGQHIGYFSPDDYQQVVRFLKDVDGESPTISQAMSDDGLSPDMSPNRIASLVDTSVSKLFSRFGKRSRDGNAVSPEPEPASDVEPAESGTEAEANVELKG